jgi:YVTN family beta-propeller protein
MLRITYGAILLLAITSFSACRKHVMDDMPMEKNIDYPAAYVVNGEDATISVIRLSDQKVSETLDLMTGSAGMIMWPHHIYHLQSLGEHRLTVAVPGMDLSAGHAGGMAGMTGRVLVLDAVKGTVLKDLEVPVMNHNAVYSPDGKEIWTSQMDMEGKVLVYDAATYTLKNTIAVGMEPAEVTFSADGSKVYVANGADDNVSVINPSSKAVITTIPVGDNPVAAWIGYDGKMYVDNEEGQSISVIDVATDKVVQTIELGFMPGSAAHLAKKEELWVTDPDNAKVHYWKWDSTMKDWMHGGVFDAAAGAHAIGFTTDGNTAYVTNQMAQSVSLINVSTHTKIKDIPVGKKPNGIVLKQ